MAYTKLLALLSTLRDESEIVMGMMCSFVWRRAPCSRGLQTAGFPVDLECIRSVIAEPWRKDWDGPPSEEGGYNPQLSEWRVAAAGGEWPAASRGLLLAAHCCDDQIFDRVARRVVPLFCQRAAARPRCQRGRRVGDGFLRVTHQDRRRRVGKIRIRLEIPQADLRVLRRAEE